MQISTKYYIGLNDQVTNSQIIPTAAARDIILQHLFAAGFQYATVTESIGAYKYAGGVNAGKIARENGICVEVIESLYKTIGHRAARAAFIGSIKQALNQESIGIRFVPCLFRCR